MSTMPRPKAASDQFLIIDRSFQLALLRRVAAYALVGITYVACISLATSAMGKPEFSMSSVLMQCFDEVIFWAPGLLFIVPTLAIDMLRFSRRFASPVCRLRQEMQLLASGQSDAPMSIDSHDSWHDLADEFNKLRLELLDLRQAKLLQPASNSLLTVGD